MPDPRRQDRPERVCPKMPSIVLGYKMGGQLWRKLMDVHEEILNECFRTDTPWPHEIDPEYNA